MGLCGIAFARNNIIGIGCTLGAWFHQSLYNTIE